MSHIANDKFNDEQEAIRQDKEAFMEEVEIDRAKTLLESKGYYIKRLDDGVKFIEGIGII